MRHRDARTALDDAIDAGCRVERLLGDRTLEEYQADELLRLAVERLFEILGEALNRALRADPSLNERLPQARAVVGFRNVLAHGYDAVGDESVYALARDELPPLLAAVRSLLEELS